MKFWNWIKNLFKQKTIETPPVIEIPVEELPIPKPIDIPSEKVGAIADFKFVDSSHHHREWDVKKYGAKILLNKCTQALNMVDDTHIPRQKSCADNGIHYSGYHFYECRHDPIKQARFYVENHGKFTLPPILDYEKYETKTYKQNEAMLLKHTEDAYKFMLEVERISGKTPILYTGHALANYLDLDPKWKRFPLWVARYNSTLGTIPKPWDETTIMAWQITEKGAFPGFPDSQNDVNIYFGKANVLNIK